MYKEKTIFKINMAIIFLTFSVNSILTAATYKSELVIKAEWGNEPEQLGIYKKAIQDGPLSSVRGPVAMDVDREGNIYLFDPVNWKVNTYTNDGKFKGNIKLENDSEEIRGIYGFSGGYALKGRGGDEIKVDDDNNLYLYTGNKNPYIVRKFDQEGKLTELNVDNYMDIEATKSSKRKKKAKKINDYFKELQNENKLKLGHNTITSLPQRYIQVDGYIDGALLKKVPSYYNDNRSKKIKIYLCPGWTKKFLPETLKQKVGSESQYENATILFADDSGYIEKAMTVEGDLISEDINGDLYFLDSGVIYTYDRKGDFIEKVEVAIPHGEDKPIPYISWSGDIYQIFWENNKLEEGFKLIRWKTK